MRTWSAPHIPDLQTTGPVPSVFDSRLHEIVKLPEDRESASLYVCGITPYDATHMGHAATYVTFDLLNRAWIDAGYDVSFVQNVTDVDDPLLERAEQTGVSWEALAEEQTDLFRSDMEALNVIPPNHYIGATESVDWIVPWVERMIEDGLAYRASGYTDDDGVEHPDGDVYFDVRAAADTEHEPARWYLGYVSNYSEREMGPLFAERGGDPERAGKKDPFDALLWRAHREGEPSWDGGSLGPGRPGWHIECTVIAERFLGMPYTVQGGGNDLRFPHHEMGAGHAYAMSKNRMAEHYVHTGMVGLDGEKMSKSKGNLVLVSRLRERGVDPSAIRLAILANHYRTDWSWTQELLDESEARIQAWRRVMTADPTDDDTRSSDAVITAVRQALAQDLDAPKALHALDEWVSHVEAGGPAGDRREVARVVEARLGVTL
ncbi:cysteine--1-D-myo-inosityl 2-amino-2-deoxy-alpha-D-glucopyranoside ligase [uncultured Kocuria sp.]|uniref:cysteine--1-D-myo-inosityl 2-amino-2-deoxy-alpha-D-glucopyranoside ligase n=1 Tax=uncultured Kocuria sp. TaxID=259305 RepID=UPI00259AE22E|nr:cysteine--1-D-myo-inosityl 2-amino-2-deoxy-alpha-D-glucopyranoside ligase [uncultured Kocuria sp.]MCT1366831.1 cysteine--1-D-myo-inosityl 2-amino-2-deoxy-alpha-D-glucopyranoside ligase [Rothia sp. p3-SID1597]